jgi:hypothetical protein
LKWNEVKIAYLPRGVVRPIPLYMAAKVETKVTK